MSRIQSLLLLILIGLAWGEGASAQAVGCVYLEGLKIPCFGGGVACGSCKDHYSDDEMQNACMGTLPLPNPPGCGMGQTCGRKCCASCGNPADYYTCESLPGACDAQGNPISCGKGSKVASCDDPECASQAANKCGSYSCKCGISCQGQKQTITCYRWTSRSVPSGGSCGCGVVGATPGRCAGAPTGASECGGVPNPCNGSTQSACLGDSNQCWVCSFSPGNPGTCSAQCSVGSRTCYENPVPVEVCADSCPSGYTPTPDTPPGAACGTLPPPACSGDSSCPVCQDSDC